MIASLFRKSTPFNYGLLTLFVLLIFWTFAFMQSEVAVNALWFLKRMFLMVIVFCGLFLVNFVAKKNALTRDNSYALVFYLAFLLFFPHGMTDFNVALANFFLMLAMRRLLSLHSSKSSKEKIFDAALWIFIASLFHFWCIIFIGLVFLSILFHVSRDYRNWLLPFIALGVALVLFMFFSLSVYPEWIDALYRQTSVSVSIDYFESDAQNLALALFAPVLLFFTSGMLLALSNRPVNLQTSYKKLFAGLFIAIGIYFISPDKSNQLLIFTFAPLAILSASFLEQTKNKIQREIMLGALVLLGMISFIMQL